MQAVILAAGKGTRMGNLTQEIPKPLLSINGKTLLEHKFDMLPEEVNEIILVIGYKGEKIREQFGDSYQRLPITYIEDTTLTGTAHALWHAKNILQGRFLVMMGDDLYSRESLKECAQHDFSIACKRATLNEPGSRVLLGENNEPIGFVTHDQYKLQKNDGGFIFTGLYSLKTDIFNYEPVKMKTKEEWGLPQTLMSARHDHPITIVGADFWISVNSLEEFTRAELQLKM